MARRHKMTPFARLVLLLLFVAPVAYFGITHYKGEDPIGKVKELLNIEQSPTVATEDATTTPNIPAKTEKTPVKPPKTTQQNSNNTSSNKSVTERKEVQELEQKLRYQVEKNDELRDEIKILEEKMWELEQENNQLKGYNRPPEKQDTTAKTNN